MQTTNGKTNKAQIARSVRFDIAPDQNDQFHTLFRNEILPTLKKQDGFKDELLLGALSVYSTSLKEYSDDQIRLLETVTRLASDALANAVNHARAESK